MANNTDLHGQGEEPISYIDTEIPGDSGKWSIDVGNDQNTGVSRYKLLIGDAESLGATARENTLNLEDHHISDLVMRIVVKGNYPQDTSGYLNWVATNINISFCDGAYKEQVLNFVAIDCAKTAQHAWLRLKHPSAVYTSYEDILSADKIVERATQGTYKLVKPLTAVYPDGSPNHPHWAEIDKPQPGDLVLFHWSDETRPNHIDHTTIFVGPAGGTTLAPNGMDKTIYASSNPAFNHSVQEKTYEIIFGRVQTDSSAAAPIRLAIVRLQ